MPRDHGIADRLRARGLEVIEVDGWRTRGSESFAPRISLDHHTVGAASGNAPSLGVCINGRAGIPGPLCQILIARNNAVYVIAAGRANHGGTGAWMGFSGNSSAWGVERENVGYPDREPWREDQHVTAAKVHAALLEPMVRVGRSSAEHVCRHDEYATPKGRKIDTHTLTGSRLRALVAAELSGGIVLPPPRPQPQPQPQPSSTDRYSVEAIVADMPVIRQGTTGQFARIAQGLLVANGRRVAIDGDFGPGTHAAVVDFQRATQLDADGIVGPRTWRRLLCV